MKGVLFVFGLILIILGYIGPTVPMALLGQSGYGSQYSINEMHNLCDSNLGGIGRAISGDVAEQCAFLNMLISALQIVLIVGIAIMVYSIFAK